MKDTLTFEVGYKGHGQVLLSALLLVVGGKGAEGHRDVLLHLDLLDGPSRAEGTEVKVLARHSAGHQVAEAGVADSLVRVLLQLAIFRVMSRSSVALSYIPKRNTIPASSLDMTLWPQSFPTG